VEDLSPYDRATVNLWTRSYAELSRQADFGHVMEAALHAVLAGLRRYSGPQALFTAYETEAAADFALIRSLMQSPLPDEMLWKMRDAAFHLRWVELTDSV
jgi:hypothetical protein